MYMYQWILNTCMLRVVADVCVTLCRCLSACLPGCLPAALPTTSAFCACWFVVCLIVVSFLAGSFVCARWHGPRPFTSFRDICACLLAPGCEHLARSGSNANIASLGGEGMGVGGEDHLNRCKQNPPCSRSKLAQSLRRLGEAQVCSSPRRAGAQERLDSEPLALAADFSMLRARVHGCVCSFACQSVRLPVCGRMRCALENALAGWQHEAAYFVEMLSLARSAHDLERHRNVLRAKPPRARAASLVRLCLDLRRLKFAAETAGAGAQERLDSEPLALAADRAMLRAQVRG